MNAKDETLNLLTTRIRQLIIQYKELKKQNAAMAAALDERDATLKRMQEELVQSRKDYESLKMAKMVTLSDVDVEAAKARIGKLIREVNSCINLLSQK